MSSMVVTPMAVTTMIPDTWPTSVMASDSAGSGGESTITMSKSSSSCSISACIRSLSSSSVGLGGSGPLGRMVSVRFSSVIPTGTSSSTSDNSSPIR